MPRALASSSSMPRRRLALILTGLAPLALGSVAGVASLSSAGMEQQGLYGLAFRMAVLFAVALGFAAFALWRFPVPSDLPFTWAALVLIELVITPLLDLATDRYAGEGYAFADSMGHAVIVCTLFTIGLWVGTAFFARRYRRVGTGTDDLDPIVQDIPPKTVLVLATCALVALVAELWVLAASGIASGDLASARGAGLIGTTLVLPLVRLADIATLLGSWYATVGTSAAQRRLCGRLAVVSAAVAALMPLMLQQRFGLLQTAMYFVLPKLYARRWLVGRSRSALLAALPLFLVGAVALNSLTGVYRELKMGRGSPRAEEIIALASAGGGGEGHFRHMWLLSQLLQNGVDRPGFNGLYSGVPLVGDLLIILPRSLFPDKPVTTMEVVNGVMFGRAFGALDRGSASVHTASVWSQFYIFAGDWGILPLAALFAFVALVVWRRVLQRASRPSEVLVASMLWVQLGWLTFNVAFTTIEVPGTILAYLVARQLQRSRGRPKRLDTRSLRALESAGREG